MSPILSPHTALVLTDLQRDFLHADGFLGRAGRRGTEDPALAGVLRNCQRLIDTMHARGGPVVVAATAFRADHADRCWAPGWAGRVFGAETGFLAEGSWGVAIMDGLQLDPRDLVVTKKGHSAFAFTPLDRLLADRRIDSCVLAGGLLASAVTETARSGATLGYRMYLASDAVFPAFETYPWTTQAEAHPTAALVAALAAGKEEGTSPDRHALIVVDMQNHFLFPGGEGQNISPHAAVIDNVAALADGLRARGWPIVWVKTGRRPDRVDSAMHRLREEHLRGQGALLYDGTWAAELAAGLEPDPADLIVSKRGASAFGFTPLHRILRNLGVAHCIVTGGAATGCLASTSRDAAALGYNVTVASDAVYPAGSPYLEILKDHAALHPTSALRSGQ